MKKIYSFVLMAVMLLIGTNAKADNVSVATPEELVAAFSEIPASRTITLTDDIELLSSHTSASFLIDGGQEVTLDLNGKTLHGYVDPVFRVNHGKLFFVGTGTITSRVDVVVLKGSTDPNASDYAVVSVGENVRIVAGDYAIWIANNQGCAFGTKIIIDGYIYGPGVALYVNGNVQQTTGNVPEIYINGTAATDNDGEAVYAAGYAKWYVNGLVTGGSGFYAKAGDIIVQGEGKVIATADTYVAPVVNNNGSTGGLGCAVVYDSNAAYAGGMTLTVTDDATLTSTTPEGYAILEAKTNSENTQTEAIVIESGTINGSVDMTAEMAETVVVNGTITGGTFDTDVTEYLSNITGVITPVTDEEGHTVYVVAEKPTTDPWLTDITAASASDYVRMENVGIVTLSANAQAAYLVMQGNDKIIIPDGKVLTVGEIVLGEDAVIEVNAGGKLIVTGAQGIVSKHASNILLHASESAQAMFLLHPAVASNKNPFATVEFISKSFVDGSNFATQRFGVPTNLSTLTGVDAIDPDTDTKIRARFYNFDYANNAWVSLGYINGTTSDPALDYNDIAIPFEYYQMYNYRTNPGTKVIFIGKLVGNDNPQLGIRGNFWNGFANSFMAPIDGATLIDLIPNTVDKAFYLYDITAEQATWEPVTLMDINDQGGIRPMQPFLIRNPKAAADVTVDYEAAVYNPAMGIVPNNNPAPRRSAMADMTKAKMIVKGEGCIDRVTVGESDEFSAEFDNGYDAVKYMNDGINMYVSADEKMSIFATDNLEDTYVGLQTVKGGNYTIEFARVQGNDLTLIDLETGAQIAMVEGNVYEFTAAANTTNDYRFRIVSTRKVMTGMENTEAVKSAKGIYTITGQYVGEMNVWNSLPAGVYVIDGAKCVK